MPPASPLDRRSLLRLAAGACSAAWAGSALLPGGRAVWAEEPPAAPAPSTGPAAPAPAPARARRAEHLIVLWMAGGPSHLDTFDPKPGRETGGPFGAIATAADGVQVSEVLPRVAQHMRDLVVVRSLTSRQGAHERASTLLQTGWEPEPTLVHPHVGSMLAHALPPAPDDLPSFVSIGGSEGPGFLGPAAAPYTVADAARAMDDLRPRSVEAERLARRLAFLEALEGAFPARRDDPVAQAHRAVRERARRLVTSPRVGAFDLGTEPKEGAEPYGATPFGRSCLLARRLVEAGVRAVHVTLGGWDTHQDNFNTVRRLATILDAGWSALLRDLRARGLLERTLVLWMGEFGRSPAINPRAGRDHHVEAFSAVLGGAGLAGGRVLGASDADGHAVAERPVQVPDLLATVLALAGVDPLLSFQSNDRPITLLPKECQPVAELLV